MYTMSNYRDRGPETLQKYFAGAKFIFLSVAEKNLWQPASRTWNFFKAFMHTMGETANKLQQEPITQSAPDYKSVIVTSRKQGSLHATQKLKRHYEAIIFSLPQIVFYRAVDKM